MYGGKGAGDFGDLMFGFRGDDIAYGRPGRDFLNAARGDDTFLGWSGRDSASLGRGRDVMRLGDGSDHIDLLTPDGVRDVINCGSGRDGVEILGARDPHDEFIDCERITINPGGA